MSKVFVLLAVLVTTQAFAQEVPVMNDDPPAKSQVTPAIFDQLTDVLVSSKLAPHLKCDFKVTVRQDDRKFSTGTKRVQVLEVEFFPRGFFHDYKVKAAFPAEFSRFGRRQSPNQWSGVGEDVKIDAQDSAGHWIRFVHDGRGQIVMLQMGNDLATYPCLVRD